MKTPDEENIMLYSVHANRTYELCNAVLNYLDFISVNGVADNVEHTKLSVLATDIIKELKTDLAGDKIKKMYAAIERINQDDINMFNEWFDREKAIETHHINRIKKFLDAIPDEEIDQWVTKFLKWEKDYVDYYYTEKFTETNSTMFNYLMQIIEGESIPLPVLKTDDFLASAFKWRDYTFKLYIGQGSFWRILKGEEQIFQS